MPTLGHFTSTYDLLLYKLVYRSLKITNPLRPLLVTFEFLAFLIEPGQFQQLKINLFFRGNMAKCMAPHTSFWFVDLLPV